jgi:hypothetical protein
VNLTAADRAALEARGIPHAEAERQLAQLASPPPPARLLRPATPGDGIERLDEARQEALVAAAERARAAGRFTKFVPASGAATRMFRSLQAVLDRDPGATAAALAGATDEEAAETVRFVEALPRLALARPLAAGLGTSVEDLAARARHEPLGALLAALIGPTGLAAATLPKALLPFHAYPEGARTALAEHLAEGVGYLVDRHGTCRFHFTVPPGATALFAHEVERARPMLEVGAVRFDVVFSEQDPATETLALAADGGPARRADGALLLRPAGHGALLANLQRSAADLVLMKNVDNVLPADRHDEIARWKLVLAGRLVELEHEVVRRRRALEGEPAPAVAEEALDWAARTFGRRAPARATAEAARDALARPIRVAGVVPNAGEPGGGPFWIAAPGGEQSLQIVESSQVALDPAQRAVFAASTHFNPVDLALALRDLDGEIYPLDAFVDPETAFVARKSEGGRELTVLERPGLWNGAMAGWNTLFVEVPAWTFAPVKTVLDLARPEHRAG